MLSLQEIGIFLAAGESGSFSEAGRLLHLSQPAVSQAIHHLERRLGVRLFDRVGRAVQLSEAGQALMPLARELLAVSNRIEECVATLQEGVTGKVLVGCSTTSGKYLLPRLIARYREQFPHVRVDVLVHSRNTVLNMLLEGQVALGVTSKQIEHHDLEYSTLFRDEVILIAPADHPWARGRCAHSDDLLDIPLIMREENSGTMEVVTHGLQAHGISPDMLNVAMVLGNTEAIVMSVEEGIGLAFVSRLAAGRSLATGGVVEIAVEGLSLHRDLMIARSRRFPPGRAAAELWAFIHRNPVAALLVTALGVP
jgi:DNA-binding transcriptional LysR family regulator